MNRRFFLESAFSLLCLPPILAGCSTNNHGQNISNIVTGFIVPDDASLPFIQQEIQGHSVNLASVNIWSEFICPILDSGHCVAGLTTPGPLFYFQQMARSDASINRYKVVKSLEKKSALLELLSYQYLSKIRSTTNLPIKPILPQQEEAFELWLLSPKGSSLI